MLGDNTVRNVLSTDVGRPIYEISAEGLQNLSAPAAESVRFTDPQFAWLNLQQDFWDIDPLGRMYARRKSNTMREGNGIVLSRQAYGDYELEAKIHNPYDGGIVARWRSRGDLELLVVREDSLYWHQMVDGRMSPPLSGRRIRVQAGEVSIRLTAKGRALRVTVGGEDAGGIDSLLDTGRVGLYSFRNGAAAQSFGPVTITGTGVAARDAGEPDRAAFAVILPPHGPGSGRSVAHHCVLPDAPELSVQPPEDMRAVWLPSYTYFPAFLLEEEICQALYFHGQIPDYRQPEMGLNLWVPRQ